MLQTIDWGFADSDNHGHRRIYGSNIKFLFEKILKTLNDEINIYEVVGTDDVTLDMDIIYLITKNGINENSLISKLTQYDFKYTKIQCSIGDYL
jgi:hypothetical protein